MNLVVEIEQLDEVINTIIVKNFNINTLIQKRLQYYGQMGTRTRELIYKDLERLQLEIRANEELKDYLIMKQIQLLEEQLNQVDSEEIESSQATRSRSRSPRISPRSPLDRNNLRNRVAHTHTDRERDIYI